MRSKLSYAFLALVLSCVAVEASTAESSGPPPKTQTQLAKLTARAVRGDKKAALALHAYYDRAGIDAMARSRVEDAAHRGDCGAIWYLSEDEMFWDGRSASEFFLRLGKTFNCPRYQEEAALFDRTFPLPKKGVR
jgi:hypothetical protein